MTQDYGAAQPIADWVNSYVVKPAQRILGVVDKTPSPNQKKEDSSWHDEQVKKANQSFQKPADPKPAPPKYHKGTDYVPKNRPSRFEKGRSGSE